MPLEPFANSEPLTFGVELELQLVSLSDFNLTAASPDLLHLLSKKPFPGNVTPEIAESMIEINSSVHSHHLPLLAELLEIRDTLVTAGDQLNIGLSGGGTQVISIGERCLLGANAGVGISLGDECIVEAGLYLTAGTRVTMPDGEVAKALDLSGADNLLFRRNSQTGAVEAHQRAHEEPEAVARLLRVLHILRAPEAARRQHALGARRRPRYPCRQGVGAR